MFFLFSKTRIDSPLMTSTKTTRKFNYFEPIIGIAFWLLLFSSPLLFGRFEEYIDWNHIYRVWMNYLPLLGLYLIHRFILFPRFFFKGRRWLYFVLIAGSIFVFTFGVYYFNHDYRQQRQLPPAERSLPEDIRKPPPGFTEDWKPPRPQPIKPPQPIPAYANFMVLAILLLGFDAGLQMSIRWAGLEREKVKLQKENIENQLVMLKNQVSPHFFMNTLNNIHALVEIDAEGAQRAIIKLSDLMRHLLYDSEEKMTPINKEVLFIESYVKLMRLRYSDKVNIQLKIPSTIPDQKVPPLLFTSLLENAFKHGISYKKDSFINITLSFSARQLIFMIENSNHARHNKEEGSGIGIKNTRKRLDLMYKENYKLDIVDLEDIYRATLTVPL